MNRTKLRHTHQADSVSRLMVSRSRRPRMMRGQTRVRLGRGPITYQTGKPFGFRKLIETGYRRALFKVLSIANLWVLSRMWSVFSLLCVFLVGPRNYGLSTPQSGFQGNYMPLQWSSEDVSSQIEIKFEEKHKKGHSHWGRTQGMFHIPACVGQWASWYILGWCLVL